MNHRQFPTWLRSLLLAVLLFPTRTSAAPAKLLFEDDFNRGIPGWTAVQPPGNYLDGPLRWQYDIVTGAFLEQSNIYTDAAAASPSATAVMLVNDTVAGTNFTFKARLTAGDDDAFGLVFGYLNPTNFYRVTFTRQRRTEAGYPWNGWNVDRKVNNVATNLFGHGTPDHVESFFNTQYQPFDVTITVAGNRLFSLTVVDDPEGAPVEHKLVEAQPLPGPASGKVGLTMWGQSGTALRGFRIAQPSLAPLPLSALNPNALTNWAPVVTLRADGSGLDAASGNGGVPIWSLALGAGGAYGTLHENSDSLGGNDAEGTVDFAAASIVAGDTNWSDYVYTARVLPADDDGHGILLRYQDERNFYRVALRSQASDIGVRTGLSVQKVVNGVFSEVFADNPATFVPPSNVPYDITAVILGNRLQVQVVSDPLGASRTFSYGPFDLTGPTLATGRIGLFSWAMARTEFDFVRVYGIDGLPLQVSSAYGAPEPAKGLQAIPPGTVVTATAPSPVEDAPGVRRVSAGWAGTGSVPPAGTTNSVTFTLNDISSISWLWRTEVRLAATAGAGGRVTAPEGEWLPEGTNVVLTAQADAGHVFAGWSGDLASTEATLNLRMARGLTIVARFAADTDGDTLPDAWELANFGGLAATADADADSDGRSNLAEYWRGSDPNFAEKLVSADGLSSRWENVQRDPALPGQFAVRDFGKGFRGLWENSNDNRSATDATFIGADAVVDNASFEGPRLVIRTNAWDPAWKDFTARTVVTVGDNDGNCVYFRYRDEKNWFRVTILGEANNDVASRPVYGVSIQRRLNGQFAELARDARIATDPADTAGFKRVRVTVTAQGANFDVRVTGWDAKAATPDWAVASEVQLAFTDDSLPDGRLGVGDWGQSGGSATAEIPVNAGALIESVAVSVNGLEVFKETWEGFPEWRAAPLAPELPAGWTNPAAGAPAGNWQTTPHGAIMEISNYSSAGTGTAANPRGDGEGTVLLAPAPGTQNYVLEVGLQSFDDDGIGFVYDHANPTNYSRVLFVSEATGNGRNPQGLSVSRKLGGAWSDVFAGDNKFVYTPGRPFALEFANNNGDCRLAVWNTDEPALIHRWAWSAPASAETNRFGVTAWGESDAHFLHARAFSLPSRTAQAALRIESARVDGGELRLVIANPAGRTYEVQTSPSLAPASWTTVASGQSGASWTTARPAGPAAFWRLRQTP